MRTATPLAPDASAPPSVLTVALLGCGSVLPTRLQDLLNELSTEGTRWTVAPGEALSEQTAVQIALCCYPTSAQSAMRRWPNVPVVAVVPDNDDGSAVQA